MTPLAKVAFLCALVVLLPRLSGQAAKTSRHDRVWPISGSMSVDLGQSSPFGPRIKISQKSRLAVLNG